MSNKSHTNIVAGLAIGAIAIVGLVVMTFASTGLTSEGKSTSDSRFDLIRTSIAMSGSATSGSAVSGTAVTGTATDAAVPKPAYPIKKLSRIRYATKTILIKKEPKQKSKTLKKIKRATKIKITGKVIGTKYYRVKYGKKKVGYIKIKKNVSKTKPWTGAVLNRSNGTVMGPSGKETYYNLPMGGVVRILKNHGCKGKYWVRSDGMKMFGKYIIVAANQKLRPVGTIVRTSRGLGIVGDTGTFARYNKRQLDLAVAW